MMPGQVNLEVYQGDKYELFLRIRERSWNEETQSWIDGEYVDLTGSTVTSHIKTKKSDPDPVASFNCTLVDQEVMPGAILCVLSPAVSEAIPEGSYVYDLQISSSPEEVETYIAGTLKCVGEVTKNA